MTEIFAEEADAMSERDSVDESYKIGQQTREGVLFSDSFSAVERHAYPDIDDGCVISRRVETRLIRKDGSSRVTHLFPAVGFDLHNLLSLVPLTFCPLQLRLFLWHYFARPILSSSWLFLAISIF